MKTCTKCRVPKDLAAFSVNKARRDGLDYRCRDCQKIERVATRHARKHELKKYGLTIEAFEGLVEAQEGRCAICLRPTEKLFVDHHHGFGPKVGRRQLLCIDCNLGIGLFGESRELMQRAVEYLKKHSS